MNIIDDINEGTVEIEDYVTALVNTATRPWAALFPDWGLSVLTNPVKVYYIRRTDGTVYATIKNRYLPGEIVIDTSIVHRFGNDWSIQTSSVIAGHLKHLQSRRGRL